MSAFYQLPWRHQHGLILDANGFVVCSIKARDDAPDRTPMNDVGELIVRAVNGHEGLVEACEEALDACDARDQYDPFGGPDGETMDKMRAAMAKAGWRRE